MTWAPRVTSYQELKKKNKKNNGAGGFPIKIQLTNIFNKNLLKNRPTNVQVEVDILPVIKPGWVTAPLTGQVALSVRMGKSVSD